MEQKHKIKDMQLRFLCKVISFTLSKSEPLSDALPLLSESIRA